MAAVTQDGVRKCMPASDHGGERWASIVPPEPPGKHLGRNCLSFESEITPGSSTCGILSALSDFFRL